MRTLIFTCFLSSAISATAEPVKAPSHERLVLSREVFTEGASFGDVNGDGVIDLVAGALWHEGPDFKTAHRYRPGKGCGPNGYAHNSFLSWVRDMNGDGRSDICNVSHTGVFHLDLYLQPEKPSEDWPMSRIVTGFGNESPEMADLTGDGKPELVAMLNGKFGFFMADWKAVETPWTFHGISGERTKRPHYHGLGVGDVNGDGRPDVLEKEGWYEAPANPQQAGEWKFHQFQFSEPGGAQMLVYDIDADGDNDVVTSLAAHAWGIAWFEHMPDGDGIGWKKHELMPTNQSPGVGGICFTQSHGFATGDFNGDGLTDFVTGKRYWAHNGKDPDANAPAVLYWFELKRGDKGAGFVPHLLDDDSGVGTQVAVADLNGDGRTDIGVGNNKGVFIFRSGNNKD